MARTQLDEQYGSKSVFDHDVSSKVQYSSFQLGRKNSGTTDLGMIRPVDCFEVVPGDYINMKWRYILDTLPLAVPPLNKYRVRLHAYYARYLDLWEGASSYLTKGRSGSVSLTKPNFDMFFNFEVSATFNSRVKNLIQFSDKSGAVYSYVVGCPASLTSAFGIPVTSYISDPTVPQYKSYVTKGLIAPESEGDSVHVNLLPFFMYQKVYRRFFLPANLISGPSDAPNVWFPEDLTYPWRINYNGSNLSDSGLRAWFFGSNKKEEGGYIPTFNSGSPEIPSISDKCVGLLCPRYTTFGDDTFTTALPFQVRGTPPTLQQPIDIPDQLLPVFIPDDGELYFNLQADNRDGGISDVTLERGPSPMSATEYISKINSTDGLLGASPYQYIRMTNPSITSLRAFLKGQSFGSSSINLNQFRQLIALSVWQERNTRTNGNYNSLIEAHFNRSPGYDDFEPRYLGGSSDSIFFTTVVQTSQSSNDSPLGTVGALGHADVTSKGISFSVPDYGYVMVVMTILPDVAYKQGIEKMWTRLNQEEEYFPEYNSLGFQAILNKTIKVTGENSINDDVFGWQERNLEFKTRQSIATGLMALPEMDSSGTPSDLMFSSYIQSRDFITSNANSIPKLSAQFVTADSDKFSRNWLSYPNYPAFKFDYACDIDIRRPMPYQNVPETFGM